MESRATSEVAQRVPMSARRSGNPSKLFRLSSLVHLILILFLKQVLGALLVPLLSHDTMYQGLDLRGRGYQGGFRFMLMNTMLGWVEIIRGSLIRWGKLINHVFLANKTKN